METKRFTAVAVTLLVTASVHAPSLGAGEVDSHAKPYKWRYMAKPFASDRQAA